MAARCRVLWLCHLRADWLWPVSAPNPTLVYEYGLPLPLPLLCISTYDRLKTNTRLYHTVLVYSNKNKPLKKKHRPETAALIAVPIWRNHHFKSTLSLVASVACEIAVFGVRPESSRRLIVINRRHDVIALMSTRPETVWRSGSPIIRAARWCLSLINQFTAS